MDQIDRTLTRERAKSRIDAKASWMIIETRRRREGRALLKLKCKIKQKANPLTSVLPHRTPTTPQNVRFEIYYARWKREKKFVSVFSKYLTRVIQSTGNRSFRDEHLSRKHITFRYANEKSIITNKVFSHHRRKREQIEIKMKIKKHITLYKEPPCANKERANRGQRQKEEKCEGNIYRQFFPRFLSISIRGRGGNIVYNRATNTAQIRISSTRMDTVSGSIRSRVFRVSARLITFFHRRGPATCAV